MHPTRQLHRFGRTVAASAMAVGILAAPALAAPSTPADASMNFAFQTVDNQKDTTFNQLLGINNADTIAGYFGSGMKGHPNQGYTLHVSFSNENFPGAAQTQVVGLNNGQRHGRLLGRQAGVNHGFYSTEGKAFQTADDPTTSPAKPAMDQLLGVNDHDLAVGFYTDVKGATTATRMTSRPAATARYGRR